MCIYNSSAHICHILIAIHVNFTLIEYIDTNVLLTLLTSDKKKINYIVVTMSCKCPKYVAKVPTIRIKRNSAIGLRLLVDEKKNYIISNNYTDQRHIQVDGIIYGCLILVRGTMIIHCTKKVNETEINCNTTTTPAIVKWRKNIHTNTKPHRL